MIQTATIRRQKPIPCPICEVKLVLHDDEGGTYWSHPQGHCRHALLELWHPADFQAWNSGRSLDDLVDGPAPTAMDVHGLYAQLQRFTSPAIHTRIRKVATAILTPLRFSFRIGHFRSSLAGASLTARGEKIPWYTYPAIDLLSQKDFSTRNVLEFGSGHSSLWWAKHARTVLALESDAAWYRKLAPLAPPNLTLRLIQDHQLREAASSIGPGPFDIIVVDGFDRLAATKLAIPMLAPGGAIIFDDAEDFGAPDGSSPITDLLRREGFARADFYGFAPGVIKRHCTSILYRGATFLFDGAEHPKKFD